MSSRAPYSLPAAAAAPRRLAALLLLVGGVLAGIAWFVPWVHVAWSAIDDEPAGAITVIPGRDLVQVLLRTLQTPRTFTLGTVFELLLAWGVQFLLVALAIASLFAPHRVALSQRARISAVILTVCAVGWVGLVSWFSLARPYFDLVATTNTLQAGPIVALLGYGCALAGLIWLTPRRVRLEPAI